MDSDVYTYLINCEDIITTCREALAENDLSFPRVIEGDASAIIDGEIKCVDTFEPPVSMVEFSEWMHRVEKQLDSVCICMTNLSSGVPFSTSGSLSPSSSPLKGSSPVSPSSTVSPSVPTLDEVHPRGRKEGDGANQPLPLSMCDATLDATICANPCQRSEEPAQLLTPPMENPPRSTHGQNITSTPHRRSNVTPSGHEVKIRAKPMVTRTLNRKPQDRKMILDKQKAIQAEVESVGRRFLSSLQRSAGPQVQPVLAKQEKRWHSLWLKSLEFLMMLEECNKCPNHFLIRPDKNPSPLNETEKIDTYHQTQQEQHLVQPKTKLQGKKLFDIKQGLLTPHHHLEPLTPTGTSLLITSNRGAFLARRSGLSPVSILDPSLPFPSRLSASTSAEVLMASATSSPSTSSGIGSSTWSNTCSTSTEEAKRFMRSRRIQTMGIGEALDALKGSKFEIIQKDIGYSSDADMSDVCESTRGHDEDVGNILSSGATASGKKRQIKRRKVRPSSQMRRPWSFHSASEWTDWDYYQPPSMIHHCEYKSSEDLNSSSPYDDENTVRSLTEFGENYDYWLHRDDGYAVLRASTPVRLNSEGDESPTSSSTTPSTCSCCMDEEGRKKKCFCDGISPIKKVYSECEVQTSHEEYNPVSHSSSASSNLESELETSSASASSLNHVESNPIEPTASASSSSAPTDKRRPSHLVLRQTRGSSLVGKVIQEEVEEDASSKTQVEPVQPSLLPVVPEGEGETGVTDGTSTLHHVHRTIPDVIPTQHVNRKERRARNRRAMSMSMSGTQTEYMMQMEQEEDKVATQTASTQVEMVPSTSSSSVVTSPEKKKEGNKLKAASYIVVLSFAMMSLLLSLFVATNTSSPHIELTYPKHPPPL